MRLTIVTEDNIVGIDNVWCQVDCSELVEKNIRALQWYGDFEVTESFNMENAQINSLDEFKGLIDKWEQSKKEQELLIAQQQKEAEEQKIALEESLKSQILALNPNAKFPTDADANSDGVATIEELRAYLGYLNQKALVAKFEMNDN